MVEQYSADPDNYWFWHFGMPSRIVSEGNYNNSDLATSLRDAQRILDAIPGSYRVYHNDGSHSIVYAVIDINPRTDYHAFTAAVFDAERRVANALA